MTSVLSEEADCFAVSLTQGQCHPQPLNILPDGARPLSQFTTLQTKDPWQIATGYHFSLGISVDSQGMRPAGLTGGYFPCDVSGIGSQLFRSIASWPLIH